MPPRLDTAAEVGRGGGLAAPWWTAAAGSTHRGAPLLTNPEVSADSAAIVSPALVAALALAVPMLSD